MVLLLHYHRVAILNKLLTITAWRFSAVDKGSPGDVWSILLAAVGLSRAYPIPKHHLFTLMLLFLDGLNHHVCGLVCLGHEEAVAALRAHLTTVATTILVVNTELHCWLRLCPLLELSPLPSSLFLVRDWGKIVSLISPLVVWLRVIIEPNSRLGGENAI